MQDLINEEEFIPKKSNYNPWRSFRMFYAVTFLEFVLLVIFGMLIGDEYDFLMALLCVFTPVATAMVMFFYKKENAFLSFKIIALGVGLQLFVFYAPLILATGISEPAIAITCINVFLFSVFLCMVILFPVSRMSKKKYLMGKS
jgi:hypothetical protein